MNFPKQINVECVFCGSTEFLLPYEGFQPSENELLQCATKISMTITGLIGFVMVII